MPALSRYGIDTSLLPKTRLRIRTSGSTPTTDPPRSAARAYVECP
jgi:hypothetical protein